MVKIPDPTEYRQRWAKLDSATRRRIVRAVNRGEALQDPREAALAVGTAQRQQRFWKKAWLFGPVAALLTVQQGLSVYLANALLSTIILTVMAFFWHRRAERAAAANLAAAQGKRKKKPRAKGQASAGRADASDQGSDGASRGKRGHLPGRRRT